MPPARVPLPHCAASRRNDGGAPNAGDKAALRAAALATGGRPGLQFRRAYDDPSVTPARHRRARPVGIGRVRLDLAPRFRGIRVVGDVHGEARQFQAAIEGARAEALFVLQLGDLTDRGPDDAGALRLMLELLDAGDGAFLLGNHDRRLLRALSGEQVKRGHGLDETLAALQAAPDLVPRAIAAIQGAPAWLSRPGQIFVHGALHPDMLLEASPDHAFAARGEAIARALFGETTGRRRANGMPERLYGWVDRIPAGLTVFCGHDVMARDGRPLLREGAAGGQAVFVDTGAGKGGHLSWIDLPRDAGDFA